MNDDIKLGRIAGFPLAMNWSVLVIVWLLTWGLADEVLPNAAPGHSPATYWAAGLVGAVLFFGSLLAHELAHALAARRAGVEVKGLTLWLFGGVASLGGEPATPRDDFRIAAVGPATSLALAVGYGAIAAALDGLGVARLAVAVAGWLSGTNLVLGIFNLVPGAPLDGGRVLRSYLWWRHGDRTRAAISAARAGRAVGFGLIGLGLVEFLVGASIGGLWLVFIGWFVLGAARAEEAAVVTGHVLAGVTVGDVMSPQPQVAPGWITVDDFVERYLFGSRHSAYPVEEVGGGVTGLVTLAQLRHVAPVERAAVRLADVAVPLADVPTATPDTPLLSLLERLSPTTGGRALVFEAGHLVGVVTPTDVARALEVRTLGHAGPSKTGPSGTHDPS